MWSECKYLLCPGDDTDSAGAQCRASPLLAATVGWEPPVHALLVFDTTGGVDLTIKSQPDGVTVMGHRSVIAWLRKRPTVLTMQEVSEVFGVARRSTTWVTR